MLSWGDRENQYCVFYMIGVSLILVSQGRVVLYPCMSVSSCISTVTVKEYSTMFYVFYPFFLPKLSDISDRHIIKQKFKMQNPNEDTEWNDVLRAKGIIPQKPKEAEVTEDDLIAMVEQTIKQKSGSE